MINKNGALFTGRWMGLFGGMHAIKVGYREFIVKAVITKQGFAI
jgi:hypothetical protein